MVFRRPRVVQREVALDVVVASVGVRASQREAVEASSTGVPAAGSWSTTIPEPVNRRTSMPRLVNSRSASRALLPCKSGMTPAPEAAVGTTIGGAGFT